MKEWARYTYEKSLKKQGYLMVAGIDEVGRGCLAGPLVASAVILPSDFKVKLYDSKQIPANMRMDLSDEITKRALSCGLGWVTNTEIDNFGLAWALQEAYERALVDMNTDVSCIILDGSMNYLSEYEICETVVKADQKVACVAAASIVAKVARDTFMQSLSDQYPQYRYETNVGYGTVSHQEAIQKYGLTDIHRKSFCSKMLI